MSADTTLRPDGTPRLRGVEVDPDRGFGFRSVFPDLATRFWSKVNQTEGCWLWTASRSRDGYGKFQVRRQVSARAHRVAWALTHGEIPPGMVVRHDCDNPLCVRPDHLRLGTQRQNIGDQVRRGRFVRGVRNGKARLSEEAVLDIRRRAAGGEALTPMASEYGVTVSAVCAIVHRRVWAHVEERRTA